MVRIGNGSGAARGSTPGLGNRTARPQTDVPKRPDASERYDHVKPQPEPQTKLGAEQHQQQDHIDANPDGIRQASGFPVFAPGEGGVGAPMTAAASSTVTSTRTPRNASPANSA